MPNTFGKKIKKIGTKTIRMFSGSLQNPWMMEEIST
jgi:hypothetical protein